MPHQLQPVRPARDASRYLDRVDPRLRIVTAVALTAVVAVASHFVVLGLALAAAVLGFALSGLSLPMVLRRLLPLNVVMLLLAVLLPLTGDGHSLLTVGPLSFSSDGLLLAAKIALMGNTIVLTLLVLLGPIDPGTLGHALSHLHLPDKLTHLFLFTVRYLDVFRREYLRLAAAMKVRAFRPRMNRHTYRSYGYLVGMLLVRSLDRSERIMAAMKCRGFRGRFYLLDHFALSRHDLPFCIVSLVILLGLVLLEVLLLVQLV